MRIYIYFLALYTVFGSLVDLSDCDTTFSKPGIIFSMPASVEPFTHIATLPSFSTRTE